MTGERQRRGERRRGVGARPGPALGAGFQSSARTGTRSARRGGRLRTAAAGLGLLVVAGVIAGCTSTNSASSREVDGQVAAATTAAAGTSAASSMAESSAAASAAPGNTGSGATGKSDGATDPLPALQNRMVIRTASMTLETHLKQTIDPKTGEPDDKADATARAVAAHDLAEKVGDIGEQAGGYRGAVNAKADTVVITMRVPVDNYDQVMTALGALGLPVNLVEKASDVTGQVVDLDSRIKTMRAGVERVRALMAEATKISEVIAIESELSSREADLEALLAQQAALKDQVALSTITVTAKAVTDKPTAAPVPPPPAERTGFLGGLDKGWAAAKAFAVWVAGVAGALVPWLPLIGLVLLVAWWVRRRASSSHPAPSRPAEPPAAVE